MDLKSNGRTLWIMLRLNLWNVSVCTIWKIIASYIQTNLACFVFFVFTIIIFSHTIFSFSLSLFFLLTFAHTHILSLTHTHTFIHTQHTRAYWLHISSLRQFRSFEKSLFYMPMISQTDALIFKQYCTYLLLRLTNSKFWNCKLPRFLCSFSCKGSSSSRRMNKLLLQNLLF